MRTDWVCAGNKLRKLDYVLHEAAFKRRRYDRLGWRCCRSNSQRQVAEVAKARFACHLAVTTAGSNRRDGEYKNIGQMALLFFSNRLFGAQLHDVHGPVTAKTRPFARSSAIYRLKVTGRTLLPYGVSNAPWRRGFTPRDDCRDRAAGRAVRHSRRLPSCTARQRRHAGRTRRRAPWQIAGTQRLSGSISPPSRAGARRRHRVCARRVRSARCPSCGERWKSSRAMRDRLRSAARSNHRSDTARRPARKALPARSGLSGRTCGL